MVRMITISVFLFFSCRHEVEQMYPKPASASQASSRDPAAALATKSGPVNLPYNATLKPLLVHLPEQNPRPPTLKECEILIEHLQHYSDMQTHEVREVFIVIFHQQTH